MNRMLFLSAVALLGGCVAMTSSAPKPEKITVAVQSSNAAATLAVWQPLIADMSQKSGVPITLLTESQSDTVKALATGKADVVWLSSSVAIDAVADAQAEAFALYFNVNGTSGYKAILVTKKSSGITTLDVAVLSFGKTNV